jgi:EAL domain-containing protein (putative c-di-GMP-specific phosphodiesterase class I)
MVVELADVQSAIENEAVIPYFQPLLDLRSGRFYGFEILARWQHPDPGRILPPNFLAIAEQSGLIWQTTWQLLRCFNAAA